MNNVTEYNIEKTNFEKKKNQLKTFADQTPASPELDKFSTDGNLSDFLTGGLFGLMEHKVTGEELNNLVTELQACLAECNERDRTLIKEFGQVYETFEALDKDYIQGILIGVKSAEKASAEAKTAQKDINDTIKALQITINKLKEFKDEIKRYSHLKDIDDMWDDIFQLDKDLNDLSEKVKEQNFESSKKIIGLNRFKNKLEKYDHIHDVDDMWNDIYGTDGKLEQLSKKHKEISSYLTEKIGELTEWRDRIEQCEHIQDIEENIDNKSSRISNIGEPLSNHEERLEFYERENSQLKKHINFAYIIAGSSLGISIIQIIMLLIGVL